jgi:large subunit ribosomal protein L9
LIEELEMKVILNQDVKHLGEEGDVKVVANGYARNYLFPRGFALPYTNETVRYFESRKEEITARKEAKRTDAASMKARIEAFTLELTMSAGPGGKLYGAVTNHTIAEELAKNGFTIERKRIEVAGLTIKHTGRYTVTVHLYESLNASLPVVVKAQENAAETSKTPAPRKRAPRTEAGGTPEAQSNATGAESGAAGEQTTA